MAELTALELLHIQKISRYWLSPAFSGEDSWFRVDATPRGLYPSEHLAALHQRVFGGFLPSTGLLVDMHNIAYWPIPRSAAEEYVSLLEA